MAYSDRDRFDIRGVHKIGILLYFKPEISDCGPEVQLNRNTGHFN